MIWSLRSTMQYASDRWIFDGFINSYIYLKSYLLNPVTISSVSSAVLFCSKGHLFNTIPIYLGFPEVMRCPPEIRAPGSLYICQQINLKHLLPFHSPSQPSDPFTEVFEMLYKPDFPWSPDHLKLELRVRSIPHHQAQASGWKMF